MQGACPAHRETRQEPCKSAKLSTASEKLDALWTKILHAKLQPDAKTEWAGLKPIYDDLMHGDQDHIMHCREDERAGKKLLCAVGAVARAQITWSSDRYSGIFQDSVEGVEVILRLSAALPPPFTSRTIAGFSWLTRIARHFAGHALREARLFPMAAIKIPRGGEATSANLLFGCRKVGTPSLNFFDTPLASSLTHKGSAYLVGWAYLCRHCPFPVWSPRSPSPACVLRSFFLTLLGLASRPYPDLNSSLLCFAILHVTRLIQLSWGSHMRLRTCWMAHKWPHSRCPFHGC